MTARSCDIVVIGSGIGGLCAAARLSYAGYKTIVLERMPILGGRYTWVDYKGYKIKLGAHWLMYGERDPALITIRDVRGAIDFELRPKPPPKWKIGGRDYDMPAEGVAGETLLRLVSLASRDRLEENRVLEALKSCLDGNEPRDDTTFSGWLLGITDNKAIYKILNRLSVQQVGVNLHEVGAGTLFRQFSTLASTLSGSPKLVPQNGTKSIVDSLVKVIISNGGEILPCVKARRIIIRRGIAEEVAAEGHNGELRVKARAVISNVGPKKTVELAGEEHFDQEHLDEVKKLKPLAGFEFWITSNGPLYDWPGGLYTVETRRSGLWVDSSLIWPDFAPKGKNLMVFYLKPEHPTHYEPRKEYEAFLADLHETFPNFVKQGGEILLARHYQLEWPLLRGFPSSEALQKTSVENLYNVGDGVSPKRFIGGAGAAESARMVAEDLIRYIKA